MTSITTILVLLATGIGVGLAQGLLGLGGAFIMVPVLILLFAWQDIPVDTAVPLAFGTSLSVAFATAISSAWAHSREGDVWWKAAMILGLSGAMGALVGSTLTSQVIAGEIMRSVFGVATIVSGAAMLVSRERDYEEKARDNPLLWSIWGFPVGVSVGILGIGGGIVLIPLMTIVLKFKMHRAVGTACGTMLFTTSFGALGYLLNGLGAKDLPSASIGYINIVAFLCLVATSLVTAQVATRIGHRLTERVLKIVFVSLMLYLGLRMIGLFEWL